MRREKRERKQSVSVVGSLFFAFFIASSVVFYNSEYALGQVSGQAKDPNENAFIVFDKINGTNEATFLNSFLSVEKWSCPPDACNDPDYFEIRADKIFNASAGLKLGEGAIINVLPLVASDGSGGKVSSEALAQEHSLEKPSEVIYAADYTEAQMLSTVASEGSAPFNLPIDYVPSQKPEVTVVSLQSPKRGMNVSFVVDGSVKAAAFEEVNSDGKLTTFRDLHLENEKLKEAIALLEKRVKRIEDNLFRVK
ncbi:MAG: hypothetical protein MRK01_11745 [Candidatus Scalindua sp.]|nr:hypothetical protein [Candidatus Scalindua sp.]